MAVKRGKKQARRKDEPSVPGWIWLAVGLIGGVAIAVAVWMKMPHAIDPLMPHPNPAAQPQVASASSTTPEGNPPPAEAAPAKHHYEFYELLPEKEVRIPDEELSERVKAEAAANLAAKQQVGLASTASSGASDGSAPLPRSLPAAIPITVASQASPAAPAAAPTAPAAAPTAPTAAAASAPTAPETAPPAALAATAPNAALPEKSGQYLLQAGAFRNGEQADDLKARIAMLGLVGRVEVVKTPAGDMHRVRLGPYATASELNAAKQKLGGVAPQAVAIRVK